MRQCVTSQFVVSFRIKNGITQEFGTSQTKRWPEEAHATNCRVPEHRRACGRFSSLQTINTQRSKIWCPFSFASLCVSLVSLFLQQPGSQRFLRSEAKTQRGWSIPMDGLDVRICAFGPPHTERTHFREIIRLGLKTTTGFWHTFGVLQIIHS